MITEWLTQLQTNDKLRLEANNPQEAVDTFLNVYNKLNDPQVITRLLWENSWDSSDEIRTMHQDFIADINQIIRDWVITYSEQLRLNSINEILSMLEWWNKIGILEHIAPWEESEIKSLRLLVYSRDILDRLWDDPWIQNLKMLLWMIESVWSSNISDQDLAEINALITEIFDEWIDRTDLVNLQRLQTMLLVQYNLERNREFEAFTLQWENVNLSESWRVWSNEQENRNTQELLDDLAYLDSEYGNTFNEIAPTLWKFLDSIAIEVKRWREEWEWNSLWWSLRILFSKVQDMKNSFDAIDFSDPVWSRDAISDFLYSINNFNKSEWVLALINTLRFAAPKLLNLLFIWVKEIKNYYIKSTWKEDEHWVFIQMMHNFRDSIWEDEYTFDWLRECAVMWAELTDNTITESLSVFNWASDALLDFIWASLNVVFLPDQVIWNLSEFVWNLEFSEILDWLLKSDSGEAIKLSSENINRLIYLVTYLITFLVIPIKIPQLNILWKMLPEIAKLLWKPVWYVREIISSWVQRIQATWTYQRVATKLTRSSTEITERAMWWWIIAWIWAKAFDLGNKWIWLGIGTWNAIDWKNALEQSISWI